MLNDETATVSVNLLIQTHSFGWLLPDVHVFGLFCDTLGSQWQNTAISHAFTCTDTIADADLKGSQRAS